MKEKFMSQESHGRA